MRVPETPKMPQGVLPTTSIKVRGPAKLLERLFGWVRDQGETNLKVDITKKARHPTLGWLERCHGFR